MKYSSTEKNNSAILETYIKYRERKNTTDVQFIENC